MEKTYVVYMHTSPSNKRYIGLTSIKPEYRWNGGYGYHDNCYFTRAINKYGWDNFKHEIVASDLTREEAEHMEIELIIKYNTTDKNYGYNIELGGGFCGHHSEETKEKIRKSTEGVKNHFYGKHHNDEAKNAISEKAKERFKNINNHPMYGRNHNQQSKDLMSQKAKERLKDKSKHPLFGKFGKDNPNSVQVAQINKENGELIKVSESMTKAGEELKIFSNSISNCCNGKSKTAGGFIWMRYDDYINIKK